MQERVRGNRNQVKKECYELWLETPQEKRDDLFKTEVFEGIDKRWWDDLCKLFSSNRKQAEAKRNKDNRESKKRGRATYTGGSRSMVRAKERVRARIEESGGSSSALKEYLGTHATLVDPGADTYSCTYPDTQTQEYCVDYHTAHPPSAQSSPGAQGSASAQPSPGAQGLASAQPSPDAHVLDKSILNWSPYFRTSFVSVFFNKYVVLLL
ncbi:uncharacterized protein A4U43_C05F13920 [Asparagus officinalis]|uniref:Uncharacterized protein n=1 Tax=Asparagus officinalis TaxID=4686 RepID=A0A5P1ERG6_ASPOF|nr:uncharacterized protein A4U43_C05F13920 [Asparagus officinalis]